MGGSLCSKKYKRAEDRIEDGDGDWESDEEADGKPVERRMIVSKNVWLRVSRTWKPRISVQEAQTQRGAHIHRLRGAGERHETGEKELWVDLRRRSGDLREDWHLYEHIEQESEGTDEGEESRLFLMNEIQDPLKQLVVVCDDLEAKVGKVRLRSTGSALYVDTSNIL